MAIFIANRRQFPMLELLADVMSDILVALIVIGLVTIIGFISPIFFWQRIAKLKFFGVTRRSPGLVVHLSTLLVDRFGSRGYDGLKRSFTGAAVPHYELRALEFIEQMWREPRLDSLSRRVRTWLANVQWRFSVVLPEVRASPLTSTDNVLGGANITVGGPYYNLATRHAAEFMQPELAISDDATSVVRLDRQGAVVQTYHLEPGREDLAIVLRVRRAATEATLTCLAGIGTTGTTGAVHYLMKNWARLHWDYGRSNFAICLSFRDAYSDPNSYRDPTVLHSTQVPERSMLKRLLAPLLGPRGRSVSG